MTEPWYRWPKGLRDSILKRDGYHCQINIPKVCHHHPDCYRCATVIDHILPVLSGGAWFEPYNLRAGCRPCNQYRRTHSGPRPTNPHPTRTYPEHW